MKRLFIILLVLSGCYYKEYEIVEVTAPNWTSDGKIVFIKDVNHVRDRYTVAGMTGNVEGGWESLILCEINSDGTGYREICELWRAEGYAFWIGINSLSSAGDWIVFDLRVEDDSVHRICVIRRDGTGFYNTGVIGLHPDCSPDASKIVYEKPGEGIWVMDRDGGNNHCIVPDPDAKYPAWSPDGRRIAYIIFSSASLTKDSLCITDTLGQVLKTFWLRINPPDWGDSNTVCASNGYYAIIIHINSEIIDSLENITMGDAPLKWSLDGSKFIAYDAEGWYVINIEGTNKWYLHEKIGGER